MDRCGERLRRKGLASFTAVLVGLALVLSVLLLPGCGSAASTKGKAAGGAAGAVAGERVAVGVSINQWSSLVRDIGGDQVSETTVLTNPGVDAHSFEPQPSDIAVLSAARIGVINGAGYDSWASRAAATGEAKVVSAASSAGVRTGENPHLWFSSKARRATARALREALVQTRPAERRYFERRYQAWEKRERAVEQRLAETRRHLETTCGSRGGRATCRDYTATESVAMYLASDLGLHDITPQGYTSAMQNDSEPAPSDLGDFTRILRQRQAGALVVNTQEENSTTDMIVSAARRGGVPIVRLTESMPPQYHDLLTWMGALAGEFEKAYQR